MVTKRYGLVFAVLLIMALVAPVAASATVSTAAQLIANVTSPPLDGIIILEPGTYNAYGMTVGADIILKANTTNGNGPRDTIIDGQKAGASIFVDNGGYSLAIDNLTLQNGDGSGNGGAIATGSGSITVISSTFTNCSSYSYFGGAGGAISAYSGSVTVTSSTFTNCTTNGGGGAIYAGSGSITITSSTFTGCSASGGGAIDAGTGLVKVTSSTFTGCSASGGGAISAGSGSVEVTSSTFTGCSASSGYGSAIHATSSTVRFCRLVGDTPGTAVYGTITADHNWWGTNSGPSSSDIGGGATATSWLVLGISASPPAITTIETSTITANLTYDSTGHPASGGVVSDGIMVTFMSNGGWVPSSDGYTSSGTVTTLFTPGSAGTGTIEAKVDGQRVSVPVTVTTPAAGTNVTSLEVDPVQPATVYAGIDGSGVYRSPDSGSSWTHLTLPTGADLRIRALAPVRLTGSPATTLYAGSYGGGVYRSTDGGANWDNCGLLPNKNVLSLVANATAGVYAGTESGVYASTDGCDTWTPVNNGLP